MGFLAAAVIFCSPLSKQPENGSDFKAERGLLFYSLALGMAAGAVSLFRRCGIRRVLLDLARERVKGTDWPFCGLQPADPPRLGTGRLGNFQPSLLSRRRGQQITTPSTAK